MIIFFYIILLIAELHIALRVDLIKLRERSTGLKQRLYNIMALGSNGVDQKSVERDRKLMRVLAIIGIPTALGVHGGTGSAFGVIKAVPYWSSALTPILFIVSAMVSGAALILFLRAFFFKSQAGDIDLLSSLGKLILLLLFFDWVLLGAEFLIGIYSNIPAHVQSIQNMVSGANWWAFWILQLIIGAILPVFLILSGRTNKSKFLLGLAGLAVVIGILAARWNFIIPALSVPRLEGIPEVFFSPRLLPVYFPSLSEWLSNLGLLALFFVLIPLGLKFLPLQATTEQASKPEGGH